MRKDIDNFSNEEINYLLRKLKNLKDEKIVAADHNIFLKDIYDKRKAFNDRLGIMALKSEITDDELEYSKRFYVEYDDLNEIGQLYYINDDKYDYLYRKAYFRTLTNILREKTNMVRPITIDQLKGLFIINVDYLSRINHYIINSKTDTITKRKSDEDELKYRRYIKELERLKRSHNIENNPFYKAKNK
jgi:hypothetical protein